MACWSISSRVAVSFWRSVGFSRWGWLVFFLGASIEAFPADLAEVRQRFIQGKYAECVRLAEQAIKGKEADEDWSALLVQSLMAQGRYPDAAEAMTSALGRSANSVRLRLLGREVFLQNGDEKRANNMLAEINSLGGTRMWAYRDPPNLVALGRAALLLGADPRRVLEQFFDRAKKANPDYREAYLASGQVALDKNDFALAAQIFHEGLKRFSNDPDMHYGLAKAYSPSDRSEMSKSLEAALDQNPHHVPSYLLLTDYMVDAEDYENAAKTLEKVVAVNPWHPDAWGYRAVLAHLRGDTQGEASSRSAALKYWPSNPQVDHLIGRKLSQKYRFLEGSTYQRQALQFGPSYSPAKIQLAQDLLRLGEEEEGWKLADEVYKEDAYDVTAYNLVTLNQTLEKFQTLTNEEFVVRMSKQEAAIYGQRVLALLGRAKSKLCQKYGLKLERPTIVEIFPEQKDFGVRTFGMPDNPGFLGVCFGSVITANSPASQAAHPANWEAVLWHEFCHVVTLQLTRNKMPRWLSEGISVYEERQSNPTWGQAMNPRYREMILDDKLTPIGKLSSAFLTAKSDLQLQFAYYQSSLVIDFLVERFGLDSLKGVLRDLGDGMEVNKAIETHSVPLKTLEKEFASFAQQRAKDLGPELEWEKPKPEELPDDLFAGVNVEKSKNYWVLIDYAKKLIADKKWEEAKAPLKKLIELYPAQAGPNNAYSLLAAAHRGLKETELERDILKKLAQRDADATDAFLRLMELESASEDWTAAVRNAERFLAVNPLVPQPHRYLARASEELGKTETAIESYETLLLLNPSDPADVHFRLARLLHKTGKPTAKRHVLQSLEEAPRFLEAHRLLLEISAPGKDGNESSAKAAPESFP